MNTKLVGNTTEAKVLCKLVEKHIPVCIPFGDNERYDLVAELDGSFVKIQCKTGKYSDGKIHFSVCSSSYHRNGVRNTYHGEIDYFGVFDPTTDTVYLVPFEDVANCTRSATLRINETKNAQASSIRCAKNYVL